ncbi:hypothetical protein [Thiomonas sp. FB-Cd]|uniref:hypothetical protein n=1 Tax=Thiomonas sp. FB-Cd TaxID=1158292 RepID=UPI0004DF8542|nr:hypothetical protein [Thiomonas sp. FB-Cd]
MAAEKWYRHDDYEIADEVAVQMAFKPWLSEAMPTFSTPAALIRLRGGPPRAACPMHACNQEKKKAAGVRIAVVAINVPV